jgi:hypothetical protein
LFRAKAAHTKETDRRAANNNKPNEQKAHAATSKV